MCETLRTKKEAREQKRRDEADAAAKWIRAAQDCLLWELPRIGDIDPFTDLGVARSQRGERYA